MDDRIQGKGKSTYANGNVYEGEVRAPRCANKRVPARPLPARSRSCCRPGAAHPPTVGRRPYQRLRNLDLCRRRQVSGKEKARAG